MDDDVQYWFYIVVENTRFSQVFSVNKNRKKEFHSHWEKERKEKKRNQIVMKRMFIEGTAYNPTRVGSSYLLTGERIRAIYTRLFSLPYNFITGP